MRAFRIWVRELRRFSHDGVLHEGWTCGGSNTSVDDARRDAEARWAAVCARIAGATPRRDKDYEADIREEVLHSLADGAVVTRNRYGAEVLNCPRTVMVDIDRAPSGFWDWLRPRRGLEGQQARIVASLKKAVEARRFGLTGARVYHTPNGVRAIVQAPGSDPRSAPVAAMMQGLGADGLYALLCAKQGCYRARLTAKPARVKVKSLNQRWPVEDADRAARAAWVERYRRAAAPYAACQFVAAFGHPPGSPVIDFHDQASGALSGRPLA